MAFYESGNFAALKKVMYKMQNVLYKCMWVLHLAEIKIFPQKFRKEMKNLNETNQLHLWDVKLFVFRLIISPKF